MASEQSSRRVDLQGVMEEFSFTAVGFFFHIPPVMTTIVLIPGGLFLYF
jgi:hypothetical protein